MYAHWRPTRLLPTKIPMDFFGTWESLARTKSVSLRNHLQIMSQLSNWSQRNSVFCHRVTQCHCQKFKVYLESVRALSIKALKLVLVHKPKVGKHLENVTAIKIFGMEKFASLLCLLVRKKNLVQIWWDLTPDRKSKQALPKKPERRRWGFNCHFGA